MGDAEKGDAEKEDAEKEDAEKGDAETRGEDPSSWARMPEASKPVAGGGARNERLPPV